MKIIWGLVALVALCGGLMSDPVQVNAAHAGGSSGCARTPEAAVLAARSDAAPAALDGKGYIVQSVRWDPLLRQGWAVVRSCDHADWPSLVMRTNLPAFARAGSMGPSFAGHGTMGLPIVRAGDLVRLWRTDDHAHLELMATAEENGAVGARVRVRLIAPKDGDGQGVQPVQYLAGVVRGPADVELEP